MRSLFIARLRTMFPEGGGAGQCPVRVCNANRRFASTPGIDHSLANAPRPTGNPREFVGRMHVSRGWSRHGGRLSTGAFQCRYGPTPGLLFKKELFDVDPAFQKIASGASKGQFA